MYIVFHFAAGKTPRDLKNFDDLSDVCIYEFFEKITCLSFFNLNNCILKIEYNKVIELWKLPLVTF